MKFLVEKLSEVSTKSYNDFANDRLINRYTTFLLGFLVTLSTLGKFYSSPISCWIPAELKRYEKFINKYCWINGTYYADSRYELDVLSLSYKQKNVLFYYQWVTVYLLFMIFCFYFPKTIWHFLSHYILDYDLYNLIIPFQIPARDLPDKSRNFEYLSSIILPDRIKNIKKITNLHRKYNCFKSDTNYNYKDYSKSIYLTSDNNSNTSSILYRLKNSSLVISYVFVKFLIFGIVFGMFFSMNSIMSTHTNEFLYLKEAFAHFFSGESELNAYHSKVFPKVAVCEVRIKESNAIATNHLYTFECVLPYNLFNEKIFLILYLWITLLLIPVSIFELLKWCKFSLYRETNSNYKFLVKHLENCKFYNPKNDRFLLQLFIQYYIFSNGFFIIRLLESNLNYVIISDFVSYLWENFKTKIFENNFKMKKNYSSSKFKLNLKFK